MTSSHSDTLLHISPVCYPHLCPATSMADLGSFVCSLPYGPHKMHQMLCEDTNEVLEEWPATGEEFAGCWPELLHASEFRRAA